MLTGLCFISFPRPIDSVLGAGKSLQACLCTPEDQRMYVVRTLVGVYRLKINHVSHDMIFLGDPITAMHIARCTSDGKCFTTIIALDERNIFGCAIIFIK